MTNLQKVQVRQSEIRQRLNVLLALETLTGEQKTELENRSTEGGELEVRYRAAVLAEQTEKTLDPEPEPDAEARELATLEGRVRLGRYLVVAAGDGNHDGAEAELQKARGLPGDYIPLSAIAPPLPPPVVESRDAIEERAVTPGPTHIPASTNYVERIFAGGDAAYMGVVFPTVEVGASIYNLISAGPAPAAKAQDAAASDTAGAFASTILKPTRIPARYSFRVEEVAEDAGLEEALRADLAGLISQTLDGHCVKGASVESLGKGILMTTDPSNDTTAISFAGLKEHSSDAVDGKYAGQLADCRWLVGKSTYQKFVAVTPTNDDSVDALSWLTRQGCQVRVSSHIDAPVSDIQRAGIAKMMNGHRPSAYAPIWNGLQVLRDPFSQAKEGQVHLTAWLLAAFTVVDAAAFELIDLKLA